MKNTILVLVAAIVATAIVYPEKVRATVNSITFYMKEDGSRLSKVDATKTLMLEGGAVVYNCYQVEMTDKLTLRKKKKN